VVSQWEAHGIPDGAWDEFFALGIDLMLVLMRRIAQPGPEANPTEKEETP
jgi:hypothetical protein